MESVKLIECPRDAWQGLERHIPTKRKVEYLRALIAAGFRHLDAVSFVSPKAIPQMADSEELLKELGRQNGVEIIGIVVNEKGAERAISTGAVSTLGYPFSISETFLRRNQNQSPAENREALTRIKRQADDAGLAIVAYLSMAFGNPYTDSWSEKKVTEAVNEIIAAGITTVSLADTMGAATPELISRLVSAVLRESGRCELGLHLHSTREGTAAKILAAYDAGIRRFDSAIGGLGGCPFAQDELVGNVATEEVIRALQKRGIDFSIADKLSNASALNEKIRKEYTQ